MNKWRTHIVLTAILASIGLLSATVISEAGLEANKPRLSSTQMGSSLIINWQAQPDVYYFVEGSPDLSNWVTGKLLKDTAGAGSLSLGTTISSNKGFYRLSLEGDPDAARLRTDDDGDGIINLLEADAGEDAFVTASTADCDLDGLPDYWEQFHFDTLEYDGTHVVTEGALTLAQAFTNATDPNSIDSDGDGWTDTQEITWGWDPNYNQSRDDIRYSPDGDFDNNGITNSTEAINGFNPTDPESGNEIALPNYVVIEVDIFDPTDGSEIIDIGQSGQILWRVGAEQVSRLRPSEWLNQPEDTNYKFWTIAQQQPISFSLNMHESAMLEIGDDQGYYYSHLSLFNNGKAIWSTRSVDFTENSQTQIENVLKIINFESGSAQLQQYFDPSTFYTITDIVASESGRLLGLWDNVLYQGIPGGNPPGGHMIEVYYDGSKNDYQSQTKSRTTAISPDGSILEWSEAESYQVNNQGLRWYSTSNKVIFPTTGNEYTAIPSVNYVSSDPDGEWIALTDSGEIWTRRLDLKNPGQFLETFDRHQDADKLVANSDWTNIKAVHMNATGMIAATAEKVVDGQETGQKHVVLLLKMDIVPDYDRDGVIRKEPFTDDDGKMHPSDYQKSAGDDPFYFWINNDGDNKGSDIPGQQFGVDTFTPSVAGVRDLVDFFPVFFDFHGLLDQLDISKVKIEILGAKVNWLNLPEQFVGFDEETPRVYLESKSTAELLANASVTAAGEGVYFTQEMLERIRIGRGVILFEGVEVGDAPMRIRFTYDDQELFTYDMELKLSEVENMYRHINLLGNLGQSGGIGTNKSEPSGFPDSECNDKHFIFVHGYNVNAEQARGWNAETFKRLYFSGSKAKFTGLTWWGYRSQSLSAGTYKSPNYYENVVNAMRSGNSLAFEANSYTGDVTIAGHSMGNIVVSSAIVDHGMNYNRYFLLNAAVATEAYDSTTITPTTASNMTNSDFQNYDKSLYASNWHELFTDNRKDLTWKDRYGPIANSYNFYSKGEEVLDNADGTAPPSWEGFWIGYRTWNNQEWRKGTVLMATLPGVDNRAGGWDFNYFPPGPAGLGSGYWKVDDTIPLYQAYRRYKPSEAVALSKEQLRNMPFFYPFQSTDDDYSTYNGDNLYGSDGDQTASDQAGLYLTRAKLLGEAIPALSYAAGRNPVEVFDGPSNTRNIDINENQYRVGWLAERGDDTNWRHSDMKNIPYTYIYKFYEKMITIGGLDE
jgi:hypothetical protein